MSSPPPPLRRLRSLKEHTQQTALTSKVKKMNSRLQKFREPVEADNEIMAHHVGEAMMVVKFRDKDSALERQANVPRGITVGELQEEACMLFNYPRERHEEVGLSYPVDGIAAYDQDGDAELLEIEEDSNFHEAQAKWALGTMPRRNRRLIELTHSAGHDISCPQRPEDVVAAARLLFNATSVPQNIRQLDLLDELEYVERQPTVLLSESDVANVAAGAHLHWHLFHLSTGYSVRRAVARGAPGASLAAAEKKLLEAREMEAQADDDFWGGEVEDAADKLEEAQRAVAAAELGVIAAVVEAPTTLKLLKVLRLGLRMRQRAADYHFEHHSPYSSPPRGYTTPQRAEVVGMERQKSGRFRHSSFRGGDDDEDDERGNSGNHHKHHHKDHHHHKHRHGHRAHHDHHHGDHYPEHLDDLDNPQLDFDDTDLPWPTEEVPKMTKKKSRKRGSLAHDDDASGGGGSINPADEAAAQARAIQSLWTSGLLVWAAKRLKARARNTLKVWERLAHVDPGAMDLMLSLSMGAIWGNLRDAPTRRLHGAEVAVLVLDLAVQPPPRTRLELAVEAEEIAVAAAAAVAAGGGSSAFAAAAKAASTGIDLVTGIWEGGTKEGVNPEFGSKEAATGLEIRRRTPAMATHLLAYLIMSDDAARHAVASTPHALHDMAKLLDRLREQHATATSAVAAALKKGASPQEAQAMDSGAKDRWSTALCVLSVVARLSLNASTRTLLPRGDASACLDSVAALALALNLNPQLDSRGSTSRPSSSSSGNSRSRSRPGTATGAANASAAHARMPGGAAALSVAALQELDLAILMAMWGLAYTLQGAAFSNEATEAKALTDAAAKTAVGLTHSSPRKGGAHSPSASDAEAPSSPKTPTTKANNMTKAMQHLQNASALAGKQPNASSSPTRNHRQSVHRPHVDALTSVMRTSHGNRSQHTVEMQSLFRHRSTTMPNLQPAGPKHPALLLAASVKFKGAALPTHLDAALSLPVPLPILQTASSNPAAAATSSSTPGPPTSTGKANTRTPAAAAAAAAAENNATPAARKIDAPGSSGATTTASELPLLEAMDLICGWSRGLERPLVLKRAALSVLTVCAAAKPAPLVVLLGVPGLTRLLMLASDSSHSSSTHTSSSSSSIHTSGAATHELHLQAAAVAALGHLSSAASQASHANKPPSRSARPNTTGTAAADKGSNSRQNTARATSAFSSSVPTRPQTAASNAATAASDAAVAAAMATERENAQVSALFQRFVNEANGMEKLSSLGKIWQTKVDVAKLSAATANADEVSADDVNADDANANKYTNAETAPETAADAPEPTEAAHPSSTLLGNHQPQQQQQQQQQQRQQRRKHRGGLSPEAIVYSGMVRSASIVVLNLSTLPMTEPTESHASVSKEGGAAAESTTNDDEHKSPASPELSEEEKKARLHAHQRNKDLVAKLQSAVLPRKRVKKVIDMVWSDHASTAEQGCAALWLLARSPSSRAVVVDLCIESGATSSGHHTLAMPAVGASQPLAPRLLQLSKGAGASLGLRSWSLAALWILLEDARFATLPGFASELRPLLVAMVMEFLPLEAPRNLGPGGGGGGSIGGPGSPQASLNHKQHNSVASKRTKRGENHTTVTGDGKSLLSDGRWSDSDSSRSSESSFTERDIDSDDNDDTYNGFTGRNNKDGIDHGWFDGLTAEERIAATWRAPDLKRHAERQRLGATALGCLLSLAYRHLPSLEALKRGIDSGVGYGSSPRADAVAAGGNGEGDDGSAWGENKSPNTSPRKSFVNKNNSSSSSSSSTTSSSNDFSFMSLEYVLIGVIKRQASVRSLKRSAYHLLYLMCADGGPASARLAHLDFLLRRQQGQNASTSASAAAGAEGGFQRGGQHGFYLERAALALLQKPLEAAALLGCPPPPKPTTAAAMAALSAVEARLLGQYGASDLAASKLAAESGYQAPASPSSGVAMSEEHHSNHHTGDSAKLEENGTADEDDKTLELANAALVDLTSRRDGSKAAVSGWGGAKVAVRWFRDRPKQQEVSSATGAAAGAHVDTAADGSSSSKDDGAGIGENEADNGAEEEDEDDVLGTWKRTLPLHLLLNLSVLEAARYRTCAAAFTALLEATQGQRLKSELQAHTPSNTGHSAAAVVARVRAETALASVVAATGGGGAAKNDDWGVVTSNSPTNTASPSSPNAARLHALFNGTETDNPDEADHNNNKEAQEDELERWARGLAFAALANLSRSMPCRQLAFKLALEAGVPLPYVHPNATATPHLGLHGLAAGADSVQHKEPGIDLRHAPPPPAWAYLGNELVEALNLRNAGSTGGDGTGGGRTTLPLRPATSGNMARRRRGGNTNSNNSRQDWGRGTAVHAAKAYRAAKMQELEEGAGGREEGRDFGQATIGSKETAMTNGLGGAAETAPDSVTTEGGHLGAVISWFFGADKGQRPHGAPARVFVPRPHAAPGYASHQQDQSQAITAPGSSSSAFPAEAFPADDDADACRENENRNGNERTLNPAEPNLDPSNEMPVNSPTTAERLAVGAMSFKEGSVDDGGLAAQRRRPATANDSPNHHHHAEDEGFWGQDSFNHGRPVKKAYPGGADAWHPDISKATLKQNPAAVLAAAKVKSNEKANKVAASARAANAASTAAAAFKGSFDNGAPPNASKDHGKLTSNRPATRGGGNKKATAKPRKLKLKPPLSTKLTGKAAAIDPRIARGPGVAIALAPATYENNKFEWGNEHAPLPSLKRTGGGHGKLGSSKSTLGRSNRPQSAAAISNSAPSTPLVPSSGRIWMWPHVAGSRVGVDCGLVPFTATSDGSSDSVGNNNNHNGNNGNLHGGSGDGSDTEKEPVQGLSGSAAAANNTSGNDPYGPGFHFFHRPNASSAPFPAPPIPAPLPPNDLGRLFQTGLPEGAPPLVPAPDGAGGSGDPSAMSVGNWALVLDVGVMQQWTTPPPWALPVDEPSELIPVRVGDRVVEGGIPPQPIVLISEAPPPVPKPTKASAKFDKGPSYKQPESIWYERPKMNDSKDYVDGGALYQKALNRDFRRLLNEERFFKFIDREDDHNDVEGETVESEMEEVKEMLFAWAGPLLRMFDYYCLLGACASNSNGNGAFAISENCYHSMCIDLKLVDKDNCSKAFLSRVFIQVNVEADDKAAGGGTLQQEKEAKELAAQNFINEDRALMRFEFLEAIVRIAVQKYKAAAGGDVSSALEVLMEGHIGPFFNHRGDRGGGDGASTVPVNNPRGGGGGGGGSLSGSIAEGDAVAKAALLGHAAAHSPQSAKKNEVAGEFPTTDTKCVGGSSGGQGGDSNGAGPAAPPTAEELARQSDGTAPLTGRGSQVLFVDPNEWRVNTLYRHQVDDLLQSHQRMLDIVYTTYSKYEEIVRNGVAFKSKTPSFSLQCWMDFLDDCRIIGSTKNHVPWGNLLTMRDARLAFFLSRMTVVDEVRNRTRCMSLDRLEFYEALSRCAELLSDELPLEADLEAKNAKDLLEYEAALNKESRVSGLGGSAVPQSGSAVSARNRRQGESADYGSSSEDEDNDNEDNPGGEDLAVEMKRQARATLLQSRKLEERVEMLLRLIGAKLGMRYQGQLQSGKQIVKFIPRYIADPITLTMAV